MAKVKKFKAPRRLRVKPPKVIRHAREYIRNKERAKIEKLKKEEL